MSRGRTLAASLILVVAIGSLMNAQSPSGKTPRKSLDQADTLFKIVEQFALENEAVETSRAAKQITAPSTSEIGATLVDAPSFTQLVALAFQNNLIAASNGALTFNLNLWALKSLADPSLDMLQDRYGSAANARLRRLGGSVSAGGKGEEFDRDGDGKKDAAVESKNLTDTVSFDVKWRFWGTRDRRDRRSLGTYTTAMESADEQLRVAITRLRRAVDQLIQAHDRNAAKPILQRCDGSVDSCLYEDRLEALYDLVKANLAGDLREIAEVITKWRSIHKEAIRAVDRQAMWTLVVNGTHRQQDFGPNKLGAGIRGVMATGAWDHTVNVDWARSDWRRYGPRGSVAKFGYAASRLLSRDPDAEQAVKLTIEVAGENYKNVPGAKHDQLAKASLRLDIPINESMSVPVTLNYASHTDLLTDQRLLTSHIGIAWDLSGLSKKKKE